MYSASLTIPVYLLHVDMIPD